jgi:hypothetical protein
MPVISMQDELDRICQRLVDKVTDEEALDDSFNLESFLKKLIPGQGQVDTILASIKTAEDRGLIVTQLKEIRTKQVQSTNDLDKAKCTGTIRTSYCMVLFVCGLLNYKTITFATLPDVYAKTFMAYMKQCVNRDRKMTVDKHTLPVQNVNDDYVQVGVSPACFICARDKHQKNMDGEGLLVLDAFSKDDQYLKYHPVVWHIFFLYCFDRDAQNGQLCCYAVRSYDKRDKTFIFIANYEDHVKVVRLDQNISQKDTVAALVVKPLELYRSCCVTMAFKGAAVLSRIWHQNIDTYKPLTYVHLLVQPSLPLYADVQFSAELEDTFAAVLSLPQADIIDNLLHTKMTDDPITRGPVLKTSDKSWEQLANAHYDLMMQYKFVIPENAKQEEILFDAVTQTQPHSQHRDYIAAVCDVRYNWVFDTARAPTWQPQPQQALAPSASYHQIDVHRHITHLQSAPGAPSDLLKRLSTGFHVTDNAGREGVIVFDVQEHGRANKLFTGMKSVLDQDQTLFAFGTGTDKTPNTAIYDAHAAFFQQQWSLCDMAYKYVVMSASNDISVHDSYALTEPTEDTPAHVRALSLLPGLLCRTSCRARSQQHSTGPNAQPHSEHSQNVLHASLSARTRTARRVRHARASPRRCPRSHRRCATAQGPDRGREKRRQTHRTRHAAHRAPRRGRHTRPPRNRAPRSAAKRARHGKGRACSRQGQA